jgi:hypothetical protein
MTYRYPLDKDSLNSGVFYDSYVRDVIATRRMNEHDWKHCASCFKYEKECRFPFPKKAIDVTKVEEDNDEKEKGTLWGSLEKESITVFPFIIESKRPLGSQYLNTHCKYITKTLACNGNVQIGSPRCVFYVVNYSMTSTQKEDRGTDFD